MSAALERIRDCHRAMAALQAEGRPFDDVYVKALKVNEALHELAAELTGDPNALMPRGHKTSFNK